MLTIELVAINHEIHAFQIHYRVPLKSMPSARSTLKGYGMAVEKIQNRYTGKISEPLTNYQDVRY